MMLKTTPNFALFDPFENYGGEISESINEAFPTNKSSEYI